MIEASKMGADFLVTTVDWESIAQENVNPVEDQTSTEPGR